MEKGYAIGSYGHKGPKKLRIMIFAFVIFVIIVFLFLYFAFFKGAGLEGITGFAVGSLDRDNAIFITANLNPPQNFDVDNKIRSVELELEGDGNILIGKQKIDLSKSKSTKIIIKNFNGELSLEGNTLKKFGGRASSVFINNMPISLQSGSLIKVSLDKPFNCNFLRLDSVFIPSLSFKTSGKLKIGQDKAIINLKDENFEIEKFEGEVILEQNDFSMVGLADNSKVLGFLDITSSKNKND